MLLRRMIEHVRAQNWTAVALDFVIVVMGVFVGMQVSNANDVRKDHARESVFLAALAKDVRSDMAEIEVIIRVSTLRLSAISYLIEAASGEPLPQMLYSARGEITLEAVPAYDPDDAKTIGIAMFILTTLDGNRLAYETMINTGGIGVVRDDALLTEIQTYYANVDKVLTFEQSLEINRTRLVDAQQSAGLSPVDAMPAAEIVARFADDPALLAAARNYALYTNRHLKIVRELRDAAATLTATLENRRQ